MKFHDCVTAPSPRRVRIFAAEKGIELPTVQVDLRSGEHFGGGVPWPSTPRARCRSSSSTTGPQSTSRSRCAATSRRRIRSPPSWGAPPAEQGMVAMWDHRIETEGFMAAAEMFRNMARGMKDHALTGPEPVAQIPELAERGRMRVGRFFETLDAQLAGREFVTGSGYTTGRHHPRSSPSTSSTGSRSRPPGHAGTCFAGTRR